MNRPGAVKVGYVVKMFPRLSETFILNEILELERQGVEVTIFSVKKPNEGRFHQQLSSLKARAIYLEDLDPKKWHNWLAPRWESLRGRQSAVWELMDEALQSDDRSRIECIWWSAWIAVEASRLGLSHLHAHFATIPSTIAYFTHRISEIPFSFTAHAKDIYVYPMEETLLKEKIASAHRMITVTNYNKRFILEEAPEIDERQIQVLHNGIDLKRFAPGEDGVASSNMILGVGRLVPKKGFSTLLDACHLLKSRGVSFKCVIVGDGEEAEKLRERRLILNLEEEVDLTGAATSAEVLELMRQAASVCLPCSIGPDKNIDALPTALLEALGCGIPAVSTSISGIPEIIDDGVNGYLVEPGRAPELADRLEKIVTDRALCEELGKNGREKAERMFDLTKNVSVLLEMFRASVARSGAKVGQAPRTDKVKHAGVSDVQ